MSVRKIKNHGKWVWQARVAYQGLRKAAFRATKEEARDAEAALLGELKAEAAEATAEAQRPATLRAALRVLRRRPGGPREERGVIEPRRRSRAGRSSGCCPELLDQPVSRVADRDLFAFRRARERAGMQAGTINRDLRTLRAMLKRARPEYRFPAGAFTPGGRDARPVAPARGGDPRDRADAVAVPGDGQARGADADAPGRDPAAPPRGRAPGARRDPAAHRQGRRPAGDPERRRAEDPPRQLDGARERMGLPEPGRADPTAATTSASGSAARRARPGCGTSTSTTSGTTGRRWPSTRASRRRS